ncbi:molybdopterin cofactor-binding domain-containing protein [Roseateles sp.]|uniref:xanthine dehydrogenase family protein molybdopterin-binding subunit n=1 Tax=Roseateles sp. TaxID=1971397 RepID=UPI003BA45380
MDTTILQSSRRGFLKSSAGSALLLSFALPLSFKRAEAQSSNTFTPNAWLRITPDNRVTVICGSSEMGQGVLTAIPMMVAEELDADWALVGVEQAPADTAYNNPMFGMQGTGGSTTVRAHWTPLRSAGAAARQMLVAAAADLWKVDAAQLRTERSHVIAPSGKKIPYGALVERASQQAVPAKPGLKASKDFKILGKPTRRLDVAAKVNGSAQFGIDTFVEGMLIAVMSRAPAPGVKPKHMDEAAARAVKGVKHVIALDHGVAVLATGFWAAKKGRAALNVQWEMGAAAELNSAKVSSLLETAANNASAVAVDKGNLKDAAANSSQHLSATYEVPYLAHACLEPLNCTAWVRESEASVWVGTQGQGPTQQIVAKITGVPTDRVKVHTTLLGGGFGRRFAHDFTISATLLSKISGHPVKLIYEREDDMAAGFYRPASVVKFEGALDDKGQMSLLRADIGSPSIMAASGFMKIPASGVDAMAVEGIADHHYEIASQRVAYGQAEPGPQVWFWRSVGHSQNVFFLESFVDEMAHAAKADPLQFRLKMLSQHPRMRGVLELAATKAGWSKPAPKGIHRGIAVAESFGSYVAEVAELSIGKDGTPKVQRVVAAVDCGQTVNPLTITHQMESAICYGLCAALYGKITHKDGRVEQSNFHDYPILRIGEMPKIEVHILPSTEAPGGIGEPGTPPIAPAVCNAIFAATGVRVRKLPIEAAALLKPA